MILTLGSVLAARATGALCFDAAEISAAAALQMPYWLDL